ncbi:kinase-like domain-containing protein, partial [Glomus cerebriforme]
AGNGNNEAQLYLGNCYRNGIGVEKDEIKAFNCYEVAAKNGNNEAEFILGNCYYDGIGVQKDEVKAFNWYEKAAVNGNNEAQLYLGNCYKNGTGIEKDEVKALYWYQKAAEKGDKSAQYCLGLYYENEKNEIKAIYWYQNAVENGEIKAFEKVKKLAEQGHSNAQYRLGHFYKNEIFIEKDINKAFYWYEKAAENGNKAAQYNLGNCYYDGTGIQKDEVKAFYWYQIAAENGDKNAQYNLGLYYKNGTASIGMNNVKSLEWFKKSAEQEHNNAQNQLGFFYKYGIGIEKDEVKAFYWYKKAAENNNKYAQHNLGLCYENEIGTEKNEVKAFEWFKKSAEQGYIDAQNKLAICYENGIGSEKDKIKAIYWHKRATENKCSTEHNLNLYHKDKTHIKAAGSECENATEWIKKALEYKKVKLIPHHELINGVSLYTGGFGHIAKSFWTKTNNYVVCKKLKNTTIIKHDLLDAFIHELKIHLHLDYSDRIIRCLGISLDPETNEYLLIMQYANSGDLQNYLKNNFKNLTWNDKKKLAFQIADGLNYLHNEYVLHRDLHSKNIVIHENNAKITDFGISKIQNDQNSTAYIGNFGVIAYMEPKRILDPNFPHTRSSDIYSFGVIMWEISSGYPPFIKCTSDSDRAALGYAINSGTREVTIPNTPNEYAKLYISCWDQEPKQRPTINDVLDEFKRMGFGISAKIKEPVKDRNSLTLGSKTSDISTQSSDLYINS